MAWNISGTTTGLDTKDKVERGLKPDKYSYTLKVSGGGHVRFKVDVRVPPLQGEVGTKGSWNTVEERSRVATGAVLKGSFTVPETILSSKYKAETTEVQFIFSRGILTEGSKYDLTYERA